MGVEIKIFKGSYDFTIDSKGRVSLPKPFRDLLVEINEQDKAKGEDEVRVVVTKDRSANTLVFFPLPVWNGFIEQLSGKSFFERKNDSTLRDFIELYVSNARDLVLDSNGRFTLPKEFRDYLGEGKDKAGNKIVSAIKEVSWSGSIDTMLLRPSDVFHREQEKVRKNLENS